MKTTRYFMTLCLTSLALVFTGCKSDDDASSAQMTIDKVFLENINDDVNKDREVTFARLGQLLRIQGSGFTGLKKILINGYDTYFNNALMTDNNVWVSLNGDTPVEKADESVRNTITLVKDGTQLIYPFTIRAAAPSISGIDNSLPKAGETVTVFGSNLQETTKITLPDGTEITSGITNDEDGKFYTFTVPASANLSVAGSITSEGANGTAVTPTYFNDFRCFVTDFDGKGELGSWSATYSSDDLVDDPLNTGRGKVAMLVPNVKLDAGGLDAGSNALLWATAGNDNANDDWARMFTVIPESTPVTDIALQFDIYCPEPWDLTGQLEFSLQNNLSNYGWNSGCTKFSSQYMNTAAVWIPWLADDGTHQAFTTGERWQTITLPLTKFGNYNAETASSDADKATANSATMQKVAIDRNSGSYRNFLFLFVNSDIVTEADVTPMLNYPAKPFSQKIYIDNLRIVSIAAISVSDFNDESGEDDVVTPETPTEE